MKIFILIICFFSLSLSGNTVYKGDKGFMITEFEDGLLDTFDFIVKDHIKDAGNGFPSLLVEFTDSTIRECGIASGMSGSPSYINGKLYGALSSTWAFIKKPMGNITPIKEMHKLRKIEGNSRQFSKNKLYINFRPPDFSAFTDSLLKEFQIDIVSANASNKTYPLTPGHLIGISLIQGDMNAAVMGTITEKKGNEIFAFGHPAFGLGSVSLPMVSGKTITTVSSNFISFKLPEMGNIVGTVKKDGYCGIYGILDEKPDTLPLEISVNNAKFNYILANSPDLTPLLFLMCIYHSSYKAFLQDKLGGFKANINIKSDSFTIDFHAYYTRRDAPSNIIYDMYDIVSYLNYNSDNKIHINNIKLSLSTINDDPFRTINKVSVIPIKTYNKSEFIIDINLKKYRGDNANIKLSVKPRRLKPGNYKLKILGRGDYISLLKNSGKLKYENIEDYINILNSVPKDNYLYIIITADKRMPIISDKSYPYMSIKDKSILKKTTPKYVNTIVYHDSVKTNFVPIGIGQSTFEILEEK